jgi:hypothetical protein
MDYFQFKANPDDYFFFSALDRDREIRQMIVHKYLGKLKLYKTYAISVIMITFV